MRTNATVVRVRAGGFDQYGDPIDGDPARLTIANCIIAPRQDPETVAGIHDTGREGVIVGLTLIAPMDADVLDGDQVEIPGPWAGLYDVEGEPGRWKSPFSPWEPGLQVALRRSAG